MFCKHRRGFTMVEIAVAMTIGIILLSIAVITYSRFLAAVRIDQIGEDIISTLREAREKTLAREDDAAYGVHLAADEYTLFEAPTYDANDPDNVAHALPSSFAITNISLADDGSEVVFQPFSGDTNMSGTIVLEHVGGLVPSTTIRIYASGISALE
jgi:prepilin-type N-terminal cleavage/methylation domain-containing protein